MSESKGLSEIENIVYVAMCVLSFGTVWLARIVITKGVQEAGSK